MKYLKRYVHLARASEVLTAILCFASIAPAQAEGLRDATLRPGWLANDGSYYTALDLTLSKGWKHSESHEQEEWKVSMKMGRRSKKTFWKP